MAGWSSYHFCSFLIQLVSFSFFTFLINYLFTFQLSADRSFTYSLNCSAKVEFDCSTEEFYFFRLKIERRQIARNPCVYRSREKTKKNSTANLSNNSRTPKIEKTPILRNSESTPRRAIFASYPYTWQMSSPPYHHHP